MSAETLRRAAAAMRRNANVAEPGRWKLWGMTVMADPKGTSNLDDGIEVAYAKRPSTTDRLLRTGNAGHIASWHPVVALAVAKAMDDVADAWEIADGWALDLDDDPIRFEDTVDGGWLAAARAYLGEHP